MPDRTEVFIAWLKDQQQGATIPWYSPALTARFPWSCGGVGVSVRDFEPQDSVVFVPPHNTIALGDSALFPLPRDLAVHAVHDGRRFTVEIPLGLGEALTAEQEASLTTALAASEQCKRGVLGGWSAERLTQGMADWAGQFAGRADFQWVWDRDWQLPEGLQAILNGIDDGTEPTYRIGERLVASDQAFGTLLDLSLEAGMRTDRTRRLTTRLHGFDPFDL